MKGFFNALDAFWLNREVDGWRLAEATLAVDLLEQNDAYWAQAQDGYPLSTRVTNQLLMHVEALLLLFDTVTPRVVHIRPTDKHKLSYMGGDAPAESVGSMTQYPGLLIAGQDGLWDLVFSGKGSNL